jgi:cytochrome subunit of sulfide dehydrogenase
VGHINLSLGGLVQMSRKRIAVAWLVVSVGIAASLLPGSTFAADVDKLVAGCADCHGKAGASKDPDIPIIGGYSPDFLTNNLTAYQTKDRDCPETKFREGSKKGQKTDMCQIVKNLGEADIKAIAGYFSKQKFVRATQKFDPELAKKGKRVHDDYCEKCHSDGGTKSEDDTGVPAGQWMPYLKHALNEFKTGKRPIPKKMKAKLDQVDDADLEALVNYYGSFK